MDNILALHAAIANSDIENFNKLLHHAQVDANYKNHEGDTPLVASINRKCSTMALGLITAGCNINCKDLWGYTLLHKAVAFNLIEVAHELILRGADVDDQDNLNRDSPLSVAIKHNNFEAVCLLLFYQADVNITVGYDETHLIQTLQRARSLVWSDENQRIYKVLVDHCDDISFINSRGDSAFSIAICEKEAIAIDLLKRGVNVNSVSCQGKTQLFEAMHDRYSQFWQVYNDELFKLIWSQVDYDILSMDSDDVFLNHFVKFCRLSNSKWLECFYLILNCPVASKLIRGYEEGVMQPSTVLADIMEELVRRSIEPKDRISIIYSYLSLGGKVKVDDLQYTHFLYGLNDEFEAVVCAGDLSHNDYKDQTRQIFKEQIHSTISAIMSKNNHRYFAWQMELTKKELFALGFYSMTPEKRIRFLHWLAKHRSSYYKVMSTNLDRIPQFPSLVELSRDQAQKFIEEKFKIVKAYQFYDVVKSLKVPHLVKDIILFKRAIY